MRTLSGGMRMVSLPDPVLAFVPFETFAGFAGFVYLTASGREAHSELDLSYPDAHWRAAKANRANLPVQGEPGPSTFELFRQDIKCVTVTWIRENDGVMQQNYGVIGWWPVPILTCSTRNWGNSRTCLPRVRAAVVDVDPSRRNSPAGGEEYVNLAACFNSANTGRIISLFPGER